MIWHWVRLNPNECDRILFSASYTHFSLPSTGGWIAITVITREFFTRHQSEINSDWPFTSVWELASKRLALREFPSFDSQLAFISCGRRATKTYIECFFLASRITSIIIQQVPVVTLDHPHVLSVPAYLTAHILWCEIAPRALEPCLNLALTWAPVPLHYIPIVTVPSRIPLFDHSITAYIEAFVKISSCV